MSASEPMIATRHEYRMKAWFRSIFLILGAPAVAGGIMMCSLALKGAHMALPFIMTAVFSGFGIYLIALAMRSRLIIEGSRIEIRGAFTDRYADLNEIKGYRTISSRNGKYTQFYLNSGRGPINLPNHFDKDQVFDTWLRKVPNLDKLDRDALLEKISNEQDLGATPEERLATLAQAKTNSIFALVIALAAAVAANYGVPALYLAFSIALALIPVALAILIHRSPLLYTVFKRKDDPRAELLYALIVSSFGLLIRARGIHFVSLQSIGIEIALLTVVYIGAFYRPLMEGPAPARTFFALLLFGALSSYGTVVVVDAVSDASTPTHYVVRVVGKYYTSGRSRSYYLSLEPWGPMQRQNSLGVSQTLYNKTSPSDQVCLDLSPGRLYAAWYTQVSCSNAPL